MGAAKHLHRRRRLLGGVASEKDSRADHHRPRGKVRDLDGEAGRFGVGDVEGGFVEPVDDLLLVVDVENITATKLQ